MNISFIPYHISWLGVSHAIVSTTPPTPTTKPNYSVYFVVQYDVYLAHSLSTSTSLNRWITCLNRGGDGGVTFVILSKDMYGTTPFCIFFFFTLMSFSL